MRLSSNAFKHEGAIPIKYSCQGMDINPDLKWENPPKDTKSFALIVDDPDAPDGTWVHWLVKDISKEKRNIDENQVPGIQVKNSFGKVEYGGPCPPSGVHRYFFKLFALNVETFHAEDPDEFYKLVKKHKVGEAKLMGKFSKQ